MTYDVTFADLKNQTYAVVDLQVASPASIAALIGPAFEEVARVTARQGVALTGPPVARYIPSATTWRVVTGFPVAGPVRPEGRVRSEIQPGGRFAVTTHVGPYDGLRAAYDAARDHILENGYAADPDWWERYLDTPDVPRPRTELLIPCRPAEPHRPGRVSRPGPVRTAPSS